MFSFSFSKNLQFFAKLKCFCFDLSDFDLVQSPKGFIASCTIQPFMINESTEDADLEAMTTETERSMKYRRNMYQQPKVQANLRKLIPIYDQMGLFD